MIRLAGIVLAALACGAASCQDGSPTAEAGGEPVPLVTLVQRSIPAQAGPRRQELIRDAATWRTAWSEIREGSALPEEPPTVDFDRDMVVLAAMEMQSCVSRVTIQSVARAGNEVVISILEAPPAPNCVCITAERPIHIVRAPKLDGRPRFVVTEGQTTC